MERRIALVTVVVRNYAEAIVYDVDQLGFKLAQDRVLSDGKRWVVATPSDGMGTGLLLAKAVGEAQASAIGAQAGGRVSFFLQAADFERDHRTFIARGVRFAESPGRVEYGTVAVFEDLYGDRWDVLQPTA